MQYAYTTYSLNTYYVAKLQVKILTGFGTMTVPKQIQREAWNM